MLSFEYFISVLSPIVRSIPETLIVSVSAMIISLFIGMIVGVIAYQKSPFFYPLTQAYVSIFRSTPAIAQIFLFYYGLGAVSNVVNGMNPIVAAIIVLSLNAGAYISESIRGGLLSVETGQKEAGFSLGLSRAKVMKRIVLPQAIPIALPSILNNFIDIVKGTSITFMIGVPDIMGTARTEGAISFRYLEIYLAVMLVYWIIVNVLQKIFKRIEKQVTYAR